MLKKTFFSFVLLLQISATQAASVIDLKTCNQLAVDRTTVDFSSETDGNHALFEINNVNSPKGVEFITKTRNELHEKMKAYCQTSPTIEGFSKTFSNECTQACQTNAKAIGTEDKKMKAVTTCFTICVRSNKKMRLLADGVSLGRKIANRENGTAKDCTGVVSDAKRDSTPKMYFRNASDRRAQEANDKYMEERYRKVMGR